jgi:hypothetical protein
MSSAFIVSAEVRASLDGLSWLTDIQQNSGSDFHGSNF